jgi:hypothetical protein
MTRFSTFQSFENDRLVSHVNALCRQIQRFRNPAAEIRQPVLNNVRQNARRKASGSFRAACKKAWRSASFKYFRLPCRSNMAASFATHEPECVILVHEMT